MAVEEDALDVTVVRRALLLPTCRAWRKTGAGALGPTRSADAGHDVDSSPSQLHSC